MSSTELPLAMAFTTPTVRRSLPQRRRETPALSRRTRTRAIDVLSEVQQRLKEIPPQSLRSDFTPAFLTRKPRSIRSVNLEYIDSLLTRDNPNFKARVGLTYDT